MLRKNYLSKKTILYRIEMVDKCKKFFVMDLMKKQINQFFLNIAVISDTNNTRSTTKLHTNF